MLDPACETGGRGDVARARDGRRRHAQGVGRHRTDDEWARARRSSSAPVVADAGGAVADAPALRARTRRARDGGRTLDARDRDGPLHGDRRPGQRRPRGVRRGGARRSRPGVAVDEKAVAGVLYAPADVEPDLVLVLGPPTRLPPSLVWELAYGELVFVAGRSRRPRPERTSPRRSTSSTAAAAASAGWTRLDERQPPVPRHRRRAADVQARRGRPHRRAAHRRERQGARRRQGRAQDDVEVRRPARADEPRPPAAVPRAASSTSSARPSRSSRWRRCSATSTGRRRAWPCSRPPTSWRWSASRTRSCTGCSSACCARSPSGRRRSSCRRSTGSCSPPRGCGPSSTPACAAAGPSPTSTLVAFDLAEGGVLCRSCRSGVADQPGGAGAAARHPRRPPQRGARRARVAGHPRGRRPRHHAPSSTTSSAASAPSPCSNATDGF